MVAELTENCELGKTASTLGLVSVEKLEKKLHLIIDVNTHTISPITNRKSRPAEFSSRPLMVK